MDPDAALKELRELLAQSYDEELKADPESAAGLLETLALQAEALVDWLDKGGFLPAAWRRREQAHRLGELIEDNKASGISIVYDPFDLPDGWLLATLHRYDGQPTDQMVTYGISPTGEVNS